MLLTAESTFMQRVHYIHQNPVRAGLVERPEDYRWSSARYWSRSVRDDVTALESVGIAVDPANRTLRRLPAIPLK